MADDLVKRLRIIPDQNGLMYEDYEDVMQAADRIEAQAAEIERLKVQLSVEAEPSPYCPICGSCGDEGCCGSKRCLYPDTGIEALKAENEREAIVAWLRGMGLRNINYIADDIEAGEHLK